MYAASSRSLMVNIPFGFLSVRMWDRMAVLNVSRHTCHSPDGIKQNQSIPLREASVAKIHVGGCGLMYLRCIGMVANDATRWRHDVSSAWTGVDRFIWRHLVILCFLLNLGLTLKSKSNLEALSFHAQATALARVEVYLYDFIGIVHGGPTE